MEHRSNILEAVFRRCFFDDYATMLVGRGDEPEYQPSSEPATRPHRIVYRADYFASALHEVAHWCLAGAARRSRVDYGYWYVADGRTRDEQRAFEAAEARPQALESLFSEACGFAFHLSADNLEGGVTAGDRFATAVTEARSTLLERGLNPRAERFRRALSAAF